jgi:DNA-binding PadR family transcriptional regulator
MQFDPDLARQILLEVEATPPNQHVKDIEFAGLDEDLIYEHIELLRDAGLVEARIQPSGMGGRRIYYAQVTRLTYAGHEFLANAKNERVWERTKAFIKEKGGAASLAVIVAVAKKFANDHFGLPI